MKALRRAAIIVAVSAVAGIGPASGAAASELVLGGTMPMKSVKMKNVDGKEMALGDAAGKKGTLVVFSCNGCPWVVAWQDRMVALGNRYQKEGIGVVFVNSNDPAQSKDGIDGYAGMQERAKELAMAFPYVVDATSDVARAFSATRTPEAFLFDGKGKLVYHGTIDDNANKPEEVKATYLADALEAVVAGTAVPVAETKSLGCAIKFRAGAKDEKAKGS
jgi:hypothetical protein